MASTIDDRMISEVIYRGCLALDAGDFDGFMRLCAPELRYQVTVFSPDLRKEMTWLSHDHAGMTSLLAAVPHHLVRLGTLKRHVSVYLIDREPAGSVAKVTSSFLVVSTDPEGRSRLFATGMYFDEVNTGGAVPLLAGRRVQLETRDLGIGTHLPL
jgi:methanesulfonate monooxygenase subunit beta